MHIISCVIRKYVDNENETFTIRMIQFGVLVD